MAYEQKDNSGSLFKNERKEKETHPDRTGTAMIDGVAYYVSGWIKQGSKGQFLSLAFKRKEEGRRSPTPSRREPPTGSGSFGSNDMNDDIPFEMEWRG